MSRIDEKLLALSKDEILNLFRSSTSPYRVCKKLGYKSSNKTVWEKIEAIAFSYGFSRDEYLKKDKRRCLQCNKELTSRQYKFCSRSCSAKFNNPKRKKKRYCTNCGKELIYTQKKYCSLKCAGEKKNKSNLEEWKKGKNFILKNGGIPPFIRNYLIQKYNNKCQICGWGIVNPVTNRVPLEVHHKDGNCFNNLEDNLELLCPNCHSLSNNFKALNKNCQRHYTIIHK